MNKEVLAAADHQAGARQLKGFKAYEIDLVQHSVPSFNRRDFYKVCLLRGESTIHYADKSIALSGTCLFFASPLIPCSMELRSAEQHGYACLFSEEFMGNHDAATSWQQSPVFASGGTPVFQLNEAQAAYVEDLFQKILAQQQATYLFRDELIRSYLHLLLHEVRRLQPSTHFDRPKNAAARITALFLELLERQFPIESPEQGLCLKTAAAFADRLAIAVRQLNRAVQATTGLSPAAHIAHRVGHEAQALLEYTDWSVAAIAASLGFAQPDTFRHFFKQQTGRTPLAFRQDAERSTPAL
ncbi:AraC family transcriptional regulator [Hymenobacter sublimis]|uniref:Helix-turn-helix domain-containing protein n=1 Tax=Hymenobacter sublimis TaxID=2933777 RepID=A0ABY4JHP7_9BACT|nr:helix-turn-helix domain-containing protein [Hymenobacter sublimis]UPL51347.1 helix-turn-helix domain-containing protein [Hymenobacter sublimis]